VVIMAILGAVLAAVPQPPPAGDCAPVLALSSPAADPALLKVIGSGPAPFLSGGLARPGERVVATERSGAFVCATIVGPPPALRETHGWLAAVRLAPAGGLAGARWAGTWRTGSGQSLALRERLGGGVAIAGAAAWGGADPSRVAEGGVNTGQIAARATPHGQRLAFATGTGCAGRMWRLGPYLVVADNDLCGGMNVTFTGVYRRVAVAVAP
jgi:hypothetical protein